MSDHTGINSEYIIDVSGEHFATFQVITVLPEALVARCELGHRDAYDTVRTQLRRETKNRQLFGRIPEVETEIFSFTRRARDI